MADGYCRIDLPRVDLPRVDLHSHAGRCFLAGRPAGHSLMATMGAAAVADAIRAARAAGMTALVLAAVADFAVLRPDPATGLRAHRGFRAGEAYADYQRQLAGIRRAAAEAGAEVATSAADLDRAARDGRTVVLLGCEGGDFLEGDLGRLEEARAAGLTVLTLVHYRVSEIGDVQTEAPVHDGLSRFGRDVVAECNRLGIVVDCAHASVATTMAVLEVSGQPAVISHGQLGYPGPGSSGPGSSGTGHPRLMTAQHAAAVAEAGGLVGAWPCGITSRSLADFGTEITRLAEAAGPDHVALGTDLDGNYRPVLTSYDQLDDLTALLRGRGVPAAHVHQILGGNAMNLLGSVLLPVFTPARWDCQAVLHGGSVESWGGRRFMPADHVHFNGSVNLSDAESVMREIAARVPSGLRRIPDGETGDRGGWIFFQLQKFLQLPWLVPSRSLGAEDGEYDQLPQLQLADGADPAQVTWPDIGYADAYLESYRVFARLRADGVIPAGVRFQVEYPTPLASIGGYIVPEQQQVLLDSYERAMFADLDRLLAAIPAGEVAVQWDVAVEFGVLEEAFAPGGAQAFDAIVAALARCVDQVPAEIPAGLHLCYGDYGHQHFMQPASLALQVRVVNAVTAAAGRPVSFVSFTVPQDQREESYFAPLAGLAADPGTELNFALVPYHPAEQAAGTTDDQVRLIDAALAGSPGGRRNWGICTECGMGRVNRDEIPALLDLHREIIAAR